MFTGKQLVGPSLAAIGLVLGVLLSTQFRVRSPSRANQRTEEWDYVMVDMIDSNSRLREEIKGLEAEIDQLDDVAGGGAILESLVNDVNRLRITSGQVMVSGPGIELLVQGHASVLDLNDLINELRNAGAEALAINDCRIVAWTAVSTDGTYVRVNGRPVESPYKLQAIGDSSGLHSAVTRPGGLVPLLQMENDGLDITVHLREKLVLPMVDQPFQFAYAEPVNTSSGN